MSVLPLFDQRLELLLYESGLDEKSFSAEIGVSQSTVSLWRNGKQGLRLSHAVRIADRFMCSLDFLVGRSLDMAEVVPAALPPFYQSLLSTMRKNGKSRYQIVKSTPLSNGNFSQWKAGADPSVATLIPLVDYLDCTLDTLVGR